MLHYEGPEGGRLVFIISFLGFVWARRAQIVDLMLCVVDYEGPKGPKDLVVPRVSEGSIAHGEDLLSYKYNSLANKRIGPGDIF